MKFDIARAWKDEAYRESLNEEELNALPANPAGELCDSELSVVCGGHDGYGAFGAAASASAFSSEHRTHSYAVLCDINIFSLDAHVLGLDRLINIGSKETRPCLNND
jgi:mersacidin/lichenicidin family type 2 lantibiotic